MATCSSGGAGGGGGSSKTSGGVRQTEIQMPDTSYTVPQLVGSQKQVEWATTIIQKEIDKITNEEYENTRIYNSIIQNRQDAIRRGADVSSWGNVTEKERADAIKRDEPKHEAAKLARQSYLAFYQEHNRAGDIIDWRNSSKPGIASFQDLIESDKKKGRATDVERGKKFIESRLKKQGWKI